MQFAGAGNHRVLIRPGTEVEKEYLVYGRRIGANQHARVIDPADQPIRRPATHGKTTLSGAVGVYQAERMHSSCPVVADESDALAAGFPRGIRFEGPWHYRESVAHLPGLNVKHRKAQVPVRAPPRRLDEKEFPVRRHADRSVVAL